VELHAAGHSAGSIFHTHFIAAALRLGVPGFATLQLLAPAIRIDAFHKLLAPHIGAGVKHLTVFAMRQSYEKSDVVARIYRKSLLYLVRNALEGKASQEILGLEECLRRDSSLVSLFGLGGAASERGDAVFAVTSQTTGRSASTTRSHTGFDNDAPTMNSLARRILGFTGQALLPQDFLEPRVGSPIDGTGARGGLRRAVCVGIDAYPSEPLSGCVADARLWAGALGALGFETNLLLDGKATRNAILSALSQAVAQSAPGDIFVFQYSGHGTTVKDISGDEARGDSPGLDEAIAPFDYTSGAFIIDDELAGIFSRIPEGVCFTCFFDCCHSGTMSRMAAFGVSARPRFLPMTQALQKAYEAFQGSGSGATRERDARAPRTREAMREVVFSACRSGELAWESNGNGEFTAHAVPLLPRAIGRLSNEQFLAEVTAAFGPSARQHPFLDCNPSLLGGPLAGPAAFPKGLGVREPSHALL
ncbi:MAG: caspase family protein, partial [Bryobacteraceae bacterium]